MNINLNPKLLKPLIIIASCLVVAIIAVTIFAVVSKTPKSTGDNSSNISVSAPSSSVIGNSDPNSSENSSNITNGSSQNHLVNSSTPTNSNASVNNSSSNTNTSVNNSSSNTNSSVNNSSSSTSTNANPNTSSSKPQPSITVTSKPTPSNPSSNPTQSNSSSKPEEEIKYIDYDFKYLNNTYYKLINDKKLTVAFIGGSVTEGTGAKNPTTDSWPRKICEKLTAEYGANVIEKKQSIGGTGSYLGAFRYTHDVAPLNPDLLFVEFAINDKYNGESYDQVVKNSESIIRKAYEINPKIDIVYVLTFDKARKDADYDQLRAHKDVAEKYGLLCINLRELLGPTIEFPTYYDGDVHPNTSGYKIYASTIYDELMKHMPRKRDGIAKTTLKENSLPDPISNYYKNLNFVPSQKIDLTNIKNWKHSASNFSYIGKKYGGYISATKSGAKFVIKFTGDEFALLYNAAPTMGIIEVSVDGGAPVSINAYKAYSNPPIKRIPVSGNKKQTVTITLKGNKEFQIAAYMYN
jgi:lysophospholipase L1-like esterase